MLLRKQTLSVGLSGHRALPAVGRLGAGATRVSREVREDSGSHASTSLSTASARCTAAQWRRRTILLASVETATKVSVAEPTTAGASSEAAAASTSEQQQPKGASKWAIDENEELKSNAEHRFWTFGSMALMAGILYQAVSHVQDVPDALVVTASILLAYVLSDLGTGVYHWSVDNYGDGKTPLFGKQIAAFQGHHQRPWTITQREFCNNVHLVFKPASYFSALFLLLSPLLPLGWNAFVGPFIFLVCMSQQFHAWSHMKKSQLPDVVLALQDAGVLISRKAHGAHHRSPFECNYCIVSGLWNGPLDSSGFFRGLENVVLKLTGVEPRCWYEPEYGWEPMEDPNGGPEASM